MENAIEFHMTDPYQVLELPPDSDDEAIRRRYPELVRRFSPERYPEKFAAIRTAYESLRDLNTRFDATGSSRPARTKRSMGLSRKSHVGNPAAGYRWKRCWRRSRNLDAAGH